MRKCLTLTTAILIVAMCLTGCASQTAIDRTASSPTPATESVTPSSAVEPTDAPVPTPTAEPSAAATLPSDSEETGLVDGTIHYTDTTTGYFVGIQYGDYTHVGIRTESGEELWFWVGMQCDVDFEKLGSGQKLQITWENIDVYLYEPDKVVNMDRIMEATLLD